MKKENPIYDVTIVGGGPVGLCLAIALGNRKVKVALFEKNASVSEQSRAASIWPATQEVLAQLGVIDQFLEHSIRVGNLKMFDADNNRIIYEAPVKELQDQTQYPELLIIPQSNTEKLLLKHLQQSIPSVDLFFSCEVKDVVQNASYVTVSWQKKGKTNNCMARLAVGADGAGSTVREKMGASFHGKTYPIVAALADVKVPDSNQLNPFRLTNRHGLAIAIRIHDNTWRIILPLRNQSKKSLEDLVNLSVEQLLGNRNPDIIWKSEFNIHNRISSLFTSGRIILAGDAAHVNSPVGGQGMNAGIQDVPQLSEAIAVYINTGSLKPVDDYGRKRKENIRRGVNRFTGILTTIILVFGKGWTIKPFLTTMNLLLKFRPLRKRILKKMAMLS
jgi:3-(3-hydroxy-phenyl)propionate hydroxylase